MVKLNKKAQGNHFNPNFVILKQPFYKHFEGAHSIDNVCMRFVSYHVHSNVLNLLSAAKSSQGSFDWY